MMMMMMRTMMIMMVMMMMVMVMRMRMMIEMMVMMMIVLMMISSSDLSPSFLRWQVVSDMDMRCFAYRPDASEVTIRIGTSLISEYCCRW